MPSQAQSSPPMKAEQVNEIPASLFSATKPSIEDQDMIEDDATVKERAQLWENVAVKVADFDANLQVFMTQSEDEWSPTGTKALLEHLDNTLYFVQQKLDFATVNSWNSVSSALEALMEAVSQNRALLVDALGVESIVEKSKGKDVVSQRQSHGQQKFLESNGTDNTVSEQTTSLSNSRSKMPSQALTIDTSRTAPEVSSSGQKFDQSPNTAQEASTGDPTGMEVIDSPEFLASPSGSDSRPSSPHNVSSPSATPYRDQWNFMSVPGSRSRGNSVDSYTGSIDSVLLDFQSGNRQDAPTFVQDDRDALTPDPGTEYLFDVENNPFAFSPGQLSKLYNPKSLSAFYALAGLPGLEKGLRTDVPSGLSVDEQDLRGLVSFDEATSSKSSHKVQPYFQRQQTAATYVSLSTSFVDRKRIFGDGTLPKKHVKSLFKLAWVEYCDAVLILLTVCALITIAVGLYQTIAKDVQREMFSWPEGIAICVAIFIVVVLGAVNDWRKQRHFRELRERGENSDRPVKVLRSGRMTLVPATDVLVGDIALFEAGDILLADGIFIDGYDVRCDESSATGESDLLKKTGATLAYRAIENYESLRNIDPFILSGSRVVTGQGSFLVTATGVHSSFGMIMLSLRGDLDGFTDTPLQNKLNLFSEHVAKIGVAVASLLFTVLLIRFFVRLKTDPTDAISKGLQFLYIAVIAITIVDVAIPSGLPLAQTVAIALATSRMLRSGVLIRDLRACETLGYTTTLCADDAALTSDEHRAVVAGAIGTQVCFGEQIKFFDSPNKERRGNTQKQTELDLEATKRSIAEHAQPPASTLNPSRYTISSLNIHVLDLLISIISITTTAVEVEGGGHSDHFMGSSVERALLRFAKGSLHVSTIAEERNKTTIVNHARVLHGGALTSAVVKLSSGGYRILVRGSATKLLDMCELVIADSTCDSVPTRLNEDIRASFGQNIHALASEPLSTIGFAYKDVSTLPSYIEPDMGWDSPEDRIFLMLSSSLIFLGVLGVSVPLQDDLKVTTDSCWKAGIVPRLVLTESSATARAIATQHGFLPEGSVLMSGPIFRRLSRREMRDILPRLYVLAEASPEDKRTFVKLLKEQGEVVAAIEHGTNVAALRSASVAITTQSGSTDLATEASAIVIQDNQLSTVLRAILWGRAANDSVQKFLQFQLSINMTAVLLAFLSSVTKSTAQSVLNSVQLLWVNLIMDSFAILALAYDSPTKDQSHRVPGSRKSPLITLGMWKMIVGQTVFQLTICLTLNYTNLSILGFDQSLSFQDRDSLVFNVFVWMQIFNQLNCRRIDNRLNIFEGITRNPLFFLITTCIVGVQCLLIFLGGKALNTVALNSSQWGCSILMGACTLPIGALIRCVPDENIREWIPKRLRARKSPEIEIISDFDHWDIGMLAIKDDLSFTKKIRGGRLRGLHARINYTREAISAWSPSSRSRAASLDTQSKQPRSRRNSAFGPATVMAGIVAGSIAGWGPIDRETLQLDSGLARSLTSSISGRGRTSAVGSVSGLSDTSTGSHMRRRPLSRPHSIGSAISVPGVVAGAIAIASPSSEKGKFDDILAHEKTA